MEISSSLVYLISILDNVRSLLPFCWGVSVILLVIGIVVIIASTVENVPSVLRLGKIMTPIATVCLVLTMATHAFVPSTNAAAAIVVIPAIVNNDQVKEMGGEIADLATEWMKALKPEKIIDKEITVEVDKQD